MLASVTIEHPRQACLGLTCDPAASPNSPFYQQFYWFRNSCQLLWQKTVMDRTSDRRLTAQPRRIPTEWHKSFTGKILRNWLAISSINQAGSGN